VIDFSSAPVVEEFDLIAHRADCPGRAKMQDAPQLLAN
jgi:hypothetical protein